MWDERLNTSQKSTIEAQIEISFRVAGKLPGGFKPHPLRKSLEGPILVIRYFNINYQKELYFSKKYIVKFIFKKL